MAKQEINQPPIERLSGISSRQLDIEETFECTRLCLGSEAKSVLRPFCVFEGLLGNPPVELGKNRTRLDSSLTGRYSQWSPFPRSLHQSSCLIFCVVEAAGEGVANPRHSCCFTRELVFPDLANPWTVCPREGAAGEEQVGGQGQVERRLGALPGSQHACHCPSG